MSDPAALAMPVVGSVQDLRLAESWRALVRSVQVSSALVVAAPKIARLSFQLIKHWRHVASPQDVWAVAELMEPGFAELFLNDDEVEAVEFDEEALASFAPDVRARLQYLMTMRAPIEATLKGIGPTTRLAQRSMMQQLVADPDAPPSLRVVVGSALLLPVIGFLAVVGHPKQPELINATLREGLDTVIAFTLGAMESPPDPPTILIGKLPEPLHLGEMLRQWEAVRNAWNE